MRREAAYRRNGYACQRRISNHEVRRRERGRRPGRITQVGALATFRGTEERRTRNVEFRRGIRRRLPRKVAKNHQKPGETVACISCHADPWPTVGFAVLRASLRIFVAKSRHGPSTFDIPCSIFTCFHRAKVSRSADEKKLVRQRHLRASFHRKSNAVDKSAVW
jgi:hypothetical protein